MYYIIDRMEGSLAVCESESGEMVHLTAALLPSDAGEGDVIFFSGDSWQIDRQATLLRRERVDEKRRRLFGG